MCRDRKPHRRRGHALIHIHTIGVLHTCEHHTHIYTIGVLHTCEHSPIIHNYSTVGATPAHTADVTTREPTARVQDFSTNTPAVKELTLGDITQGAEQAVAQGLQQVNNSAQNAMKGAANNHPAASVQTNANRASLAAERIERAAVHLPANHPAQDAVPLAHELAGQAQHEAAKAHANETQGKAAQGDGEGAVDSAGKAAASAAQAAAHNEAANPVPVNTPSLGPSTYKSTIIQDGNNIAIVGGTPLTPATPSVLAFRSGNPFQPGNPFLEDARTVPLPIENPAGNNPFAQYEDALREPLPPAPIANSLNAAANNLAAQGQPQAAQQVADQAAAVEHYYKGTYGVSFKGGKGHYTTAHGRPGVTKQATMNRYQASYNKDPEKFMASSAARAHKNAIRQFRTQYPVVR